MFAFKRYNCHAKCCKLYLEALYDGKMLSSHVCASPVPLSERMRIVVVVRVEMPARVRSISARPEALLCTDRRKKETFVSHRPIPLDLPARKEGNMQKARLATQAESLRLSTEWTKV
jgi:hypothetical protein